MFTYLRVLLSMNKKPILTSVGVILILALIYGVYKHYTSLTDTITQLESSVRHEKGKNQVLEKKDKLIDESISRFTEESKVILAEQNKLKEKLLDSKLAIISDTELTKEETEQRLSELQLISTWEAFCKLNPSEDCQTILRGVK